MNMNAFKKFVFIVIGRVNDSNVKVPAFGATWWIITILQLSTTKLTLSATTQKQSNGFRVKRANTRDQNIQKKENYK